MDQQHVFDQLAYIARGQSTLSPEDREKVLARAILLLFAAAGNLDVLREIAAETLWES